MQSDKYWLSRNRKPAKFTSNSALFYSNSTNIGHIANLNAGGDRAPKITQSTYSSYHDTILCRKLNCSQSTSKVIRSIKWNHGPGNNPLLGTQCRFVGGSCLGPGPAGCFQPGLQPGCRELLLTLHWSLALLIIDPWQVLYSVISQDIGWCTNFHFALNT